jgi:hypothetical protein
MSMPMGWLAFGKARDQPDIHLVAKGFCQNYVEEIPGLAKDSDLRHVGRD